MGQTKRGVDVKSSATVGLDVRAAMRCSCGGTEVQRGLWLWRVVVVVVVAVVVVVVVVMCGCCGGGDGGSGGGGDVGGSCFCS